MKKILIVDDSYEMRSVLKLYLSLHFEDVSDVGSGEEALRFIKEREVDLVISDLEMKDGNGLWLLDEMQSLDSSPKVIILSGNRYVSEKMIRASGATAFFPKPLDFEYLLTYIQKIHCD